MTETLISAFVQLRTVVEAFNSRITELEKRFTEVEHDLSELGATLTALLAPLEIEVPDQPPADSPATTESPDAVVVSPNAEPSSSADDILADFEGLRKKHANKP